MTEVSSLADIGTEQSAHFEILIDLFIRSNTERIINLTGSIDSRKGSVKNLLIIIHITVKY